MALFPYVPNIERCQAVVLDAWEREHPDIKLHFTDWNCYHSDPDGSLDVFVFDAIFLSSFAEKGYLLPIPSGIIRDSEDLFPFTLEGCMYGGKLYALPQLLCADLLYTRKDDTALSGVSDIMTLYGILGARETEGVIPEENEGLLIDLSDMLFMSAMYLDALMDEQQTYTDYSVLPETSDLSEQALEQLRAMWKMGGAKQVSYWPEDDDSYVRARWFAEGKGRAYIGYSEAMAVMGDAVNRVTVRLISYGAGENIALFYTDVVGISPGLDEDKKELAFELANILISEEVLAGFNTPANDGDSPQYLLAARRSVYDDLRQDYPIYGCLKEIVDGADHRVFRMGVEVRPFITDMEVVLAEAIDQDQTE